MTLALPREILNKVEQRWTARATQAESFQLATDRVQQHGRAPADAAADQAHAPTLESPVKRN